MHQYGILLIFLYPDTNIRCLPIINKVIAGNSGHTQTSDNYTYFVLVLNKEQHCNYNSSIVTSYPHMLENEHDTMSMQYIIYSQIRDSL